LLFPPISSVSRSHDVQLGLKNAKSIWHEKFKINLERKTQNQFATTIKFVLHSIGKCYSTSDQGIDRIGELDCLHSAGICRLHRVSSLPSKQISTSDQGIDRIGAGECLHSAGLHSAGICRLHRVSSLPSKHLINHPFNPRSQSTACRDAMPRVSTAPHFIEPIKTPHKASVQSPEQLYCL